MNQYLVISDLHGALDAAKFMEEAAERYSCNRILCLGDILYHGPRNDLPDSYAPKKVSPVMNRFAKHITAVRGNCDAEVDQMVLDFPIRSDCSTFFLGSRAVFMTHGHIYSPEKLPPLREGDIFLYGHTHIPMAEEQQGIYLLNPGSAALPKNGHPRSYGILNETSFTIFTAEHEVYMQIEF